MCPVIDAVPKKDADALSNRTHEACKCMESNKQTAKQKDIYQNIVPDLIKPQF